MSTPPRPPINKAWNGLCNIPPRNRSLCCLRAVASSFGSTLFEEVPPPVAAPSPPLVDDVPARRLLVETLVFVPGPLIGDDRRLPEGLGAVAAAPLLLLPLL